MCHCPLGANGGQLRPILTPTSSCKFFFDLALFLGAKNVLLLSCCAVVRLFVVAVLFLFLSLLMSTIYDLGWDVLVNILSRCSAKDVSHHTNTNTNTYNNKLTSQQVISFSRTCQDFSCYAEDGWLWRFEFEFSFVFWFVFDTGYTHRALLSRDFGDCDGMKGYLSHPLHTLPPTNQLTQPTKDLMY